MAAGAWWSEAALGRAWARVRENQGCAGADGVTIERFEQDREGELGALREEVETESYWAWPLRKIEVEKAPGSEERRGLVVPAVRDRVLETAVAARLEPVLEAEFEECSFGYRRGRGVRMAVERVHVLYQEGYHWLLDADIEAFFDSVDRELLLGRLGELVHEERLVRLVRLWLERPVWDGLGLLRPERGIPQGSVVSPMLANLCLDELDERLLGAGLKMVRYADDFVVLAKSRKVAERARELSGEVLGELRLRLHEGKSQIVRFSEGFRFLGVIFLKDLLLQPWRGKRKRLRVLSAAPPIPAAFLGEKDRRRLRQVRV